MATGLVKWWRARFLAGYKPFSVVGGIAEGSDSEELLGAGVPSPCMSPSTPLPATLLVVTPDETLPDVTSNETQNTQNDCEQQTSSSIPNGTRQLSFEEFECDVSVAEGNRKRQEFSFTLYDFDGHGKITKDDIAGLVTTIYDTLGASIQVPPCGSKTIKVKLTVSPDKNTATASTMTPNHNGIITTDTSTLPTLSTTPTVPIAPTTTTTTTTTTTSLPNNIGSNNNTSCCHNKNVNSCSHGNQSNRRIPRRRRIIRSRAEPRRLIESHSDDDADNVPPLTISQIKQEELRKRVGPVPNLPSPTPYSNSSEGDSEGDDSDLSPSLTPLTPLTPLVTKQRKRSSSMQRQQLLEIIQANMEKNNLSFHTSRKRYQNEQHQQQQQHQHQHQHQHQQRSPYSEPTSPYNIQKNHQSLNKTNQKISITNYHKPVREYLNKITTNTKLSTKCRTNLRKNRNQHNTSIQRNTKATPDKSLRNNLQPSPIVTQNILNTEPNKQCNNINSNNINNNNNNNINNNNINNNHNNNINHNNNNNNNNNINSNQHNDIDYLNTLQSFNKTSKKHQLKHATREQDQARAMAQVVKWLETEFKQKEAATSGTGGRHHVHEHIHHHYHHYAEPAIV